MSCPDKAVPGQPDALVPDPGAGADRRRSLEDWVGHAPEQLAAMRAHLADLASRGAEEIDDERTLAAFLPRPPRGPGGDDERSGLPFTAYRPGPVASIRVTGADAANGPGTTSPRRIPQRSALRSRSDPSGLV